MKPVLISLACLALLAACNPQSSVAPAASEPTPSSTISTNQTVTIPTARGDTQLKSPPQKVAIFDLASLDTLQALGIAVAGVPDKVYAPYLQSAAKHAQVVGTVFEPNLEALHAMQPDLVIVAARSAPKYDELSKLFTTIDMSDDGDDLIGDGLKRLDAMGKLFHKQAQAEKLHSALTTLLEETRTAAHGKGNAMIVMVNAGKLSTFGAGSRFGWIHRDLGFSEANAYVKASPHGEPISFEFIQKTNPDWLFVLDRSAAIGEEGQSAQTILDTALVHNTNAWKNNHVVYLSSASYVAPGGIQQMTEDLTNINKALRQ